MLTFRYNKLLNHLHLFQTLPMKTSFEVNYLLKILAKHGKYSKLSVWHCLLFSFASVFTQECRWSRWLRQMLTTQHMATALVWSTASWRVSHTSQWMPKPVQLLTNATKQHSEVLFSICWNWRVKMSYHSNGLDRLFNWWLSRFLDCKLMLIHHF